MLILMGYIHLDPSDAEAFAADIEATGSSTRREEGCLFYGVAPDDASAGRFLVAERWQDQASLDAHLERPETRAFLQTWTERMKGELQFYEASEQKPLGD
ncbi:MAG: antibiotic biosynthesis monooxygenase [Rhizobium sp.]|nr:MAG: antibiotic biosynthesis monooxygenase [Rhizobium sp.]